MAPLLTFLYSLALPLLLPSNATLKQNGEEFMRMHSNTIFITGGSSGIGKGLAEAFHQLGNQVIICARRRKLLERICAANPGMRHFVLDVTDPRAIRRVADRIVKEFPNLNCVINNAGVQMPHDFAGRKPPDEQRMLEEISANLLGVIRVTAAFLPCLRKQKSATIVNVTSGIGFVPIARTPIYCATKAAVHSFSLSLRHQLKDSPVKVVELIPPLVDTKLGGFSKRAGGGIPTPMPLDTFIAATMEGLAGNADEVAIGDAKNLTGASGLETVKKIFARMNG